MVFYLVELNKELEVAPRFFGPKLREEIDRRLRQEVRRSRPHAAQGAHGGLLELVPSTLDLWPLAPEQLHKRADDRSLGCCRWRAPATASTALCCRCSTSSTPARAW